MQTLQTFHVYYRAWPKKNLRHVMATCETAGEAILGVEELLKEEKEIYLKPVFAMVVGGGKEL